MSEPDHQVPAAPERVPLHHDNPQLYRRRLRSGVLGVLLFAAAAGGIAGLIGGRVAGIAVAAIIGLPLLYVLSANLRRKIWLEGSTVLVRTWGVRRIDLVTAGRLDVVITDLRGARTVALLVNGGQRGRSVKIDLAVYSGTAGWELDVLALRKLANALVNNIEANGMVFSELLVAQLRAEARGDGLVARPLFRLAAAAPGGKLAQRYTMEAISRFVASMD